MNWNSVDEESLLPSSVTGSQHSEPLANAIRRITDDAVEELTTAKRRVGQVGRKRVPELVYRSILLKVRAQSRPRLLALETSRVNIRPERQGSEMRSRHTKASRSNKRIKE